MHRFRYGQLIEINAHSLFSKWFSEVRLYVACKLHACSHFGQSGKLVMKMFQHIHELLDDEDALVCVLIDEVPHKLSK